MNVPFGIGQPVRRKEDLRLVTGRGEFSDDLDAPGQAHAIILRAPHAHAIIRAIDTSAARAAPGVLAILTGRDYVADGGKPIPNTPNPRDIPVLNMDSRPWVQPPDFPLAVDKVRHVGEGVAMVVAETRREALDAAELVRVDYQVLPAVVTVADALRTGAPAVWDQAPGNLCVDGERGNKAEVDAAFARAAHVVRMELKNNRVTGLPLEPAAALGLYDAATGAATLRAGGQGILIQKRALCGTLGIAEDKMRVICRDVGGGFGTKNLLYREYALVVWAARRLGRPVKWRGERSEAFFFDPYGRDLASTAELALAADGTFLAVRTHNIQNLGSQTIHLVPLARGAAVTNGVYAIPAVHARLTAVFTNTTPTSTYRGAGRPEAMFIIERLIDTAAAEMGLDRVALRRKNFIRPDMLPYVNPMGTRYDSGEFEANMKRALAMIDAAGFAARRREARKRGKRRGLGFANFIETATGIPPERAVLKVHGEGRVTVTLGTQASGQGHETAFAQCLTEWLGVPFDAIELIHGDSDVVTMGSGSHSCRSMRLAGLLMGRAATEIIAKGKELAARALQADAGQVEFADGRFTVSGSARAIDLFEAARLPAELGEPQLALEAAAEITTMLPTFPNGCHAAEVEVDPETGGVTITRYVGVDDVGRVINPLIVHGQMHGSTVQGIGQALTEDCVYDRESGQLLSGSFMDYAIPRADMVPSFESATNEVPAPNNPLGVKGAGEGGTTGAPPAVINAIVDALREYGVRDITMPATPERVWQAIHKANSE
jgi:carbon-monoxide dehydrogenase large subunit